MTTQKPLFPHRFDAAFAGDLDSVHDAVANSIGRTKSILNLLVIAAPDNIMGDALFAAIAELDDIAGMLNAHVAAVDSAKTGVTHD